MPSLIFRLPSSARSSSGLAPKAAGLPAPAMTVLTTCKGQPCRCWYRTRESRQVIDIAVGAKMRQISVQRFRRFHRLARVSGVLRMTTRKTSPPTLPGCSVLPPMDSSKGGKRPTSGNQEKAPRKEKPNRRKTGDRFAVFNTFADFTVRDLSRAEIAVWLLLWRDTREGTARTSQVDLARRAGMDPSTVKRAVKRLEKRGLLTVVFRGDLWQGPSRYAVHPRSQPPGEGKLDKPTHPSSGGH